MTETGMTSGPTVLTVLLNWRTAEMTLKAADAAERAMAGIAGGIVIVDNDSGDGSFERMAEAIQGRERIRVVQSGRNGGFGAGNNVGIKLGLAGGARPDFVYILNSDAFPAPDAIRLLLDYLQAHPKVGIVGSYIHGPDGEPHTTCFRFPSVASEFEGAARTGPISRLLAKRAVAIGVPEATGPVDWLAGDAAGRGGSYGWHLRRDVLSVFRGDRPLSPRGRGGLAHAFRPRKPGGAYRLGFDWDEDLEASAGLLVRQPLALFPEVRGNVTRGHGDAGASGWRADPASAAAGAAPHSRRAAAFSARSCRACAAQSSAPGQSARQMKAGGPWTARISFCD
jgi:Glycosyl transferase family 2